MVDREMKAGDVSIRNFAKEDYSDLEKGVFSGNNFIPKNVPKGSVLASHSRSVLGCLSS